jgi:hypothetical protein
MAGYSGTPLLKKLGMKPFFETYVQNQPEDYLDWLHPLPEGVHIKNRLSGEFDFMHLFVSDRKTFQSSFTKAKRFLKKNGMLWISWPKKSSGISTDLDENVIRDFGLAEGLVDVKVCAVDDVWSGLKFVVRLKDR